MATWEAIEAAYPHAARARRGWSKMPVAHLATVRRDGAPRIHPVCPHIADGRLFIAVSSTSPKRLDLLNDGRYALHTIDASEPGPDFDEFEFTITGRAHRIPNSDATTWAAVRAVCPYPIPDEDWLFQLDIESAMSSTWDPMDTPGRRAYRLMWRPGWDTPRPPANELPA